MWYSSFWSEGSINRLNLKILVPGTSNDGAEGPRIAAHCALSIKSEVKKEQKIFVPQLKEKESVSIEGEYQNPGSGLVRRPQTFKTIFTIFNPHQSNRFKKK